MKFRIQLMFILLAGVVTGCGGDSATVTEKDRAPTQPPSTAVAEQPATEPSYDV
jgi:hypothetical protein